LQHRWNYLHEDFMTVTERRFVWLSVILAIIVAVVLAEFSLWVMEKHQKRTTPDFGNVKRFLKMGWGGYLIENFSAQVTDGYGGKVQWTNNAQGFRSDHEFTPEPMPGVLRVLSIGDSFTAGYRVGQHETFSSLQDQLINREYGKAEVMVAEISDPANGLYYLEHYGLRLKPHIVLLGITLGNDISQAYLGLDPQGSYILTLKDGQVHLELNHNPPMALKQLSAYKIPPEYLVSQSLWERVVRQISRWTKRRRLLRRFFQEQEAITTGGDWQHPSLFDDADGLGMFTDPPPPEIVEAYARLFRCLEAFSLLCRQHHIIFAVQIFPQRYQVQPGDWDKAVRQYGLKKSRFDLMAPNRRIGAFCREHGIEVLDPTAAMAQWYAKNRQNMYYPRGDMHMKRIGHQVFFECSRPAFSQLIQAGLKLAQGSYPRARRISSGAGLP
jgi:hypothetical protein